MFEANLIVQIAKQDRVIELQDKLITVLNQDIENYKATVQAQDELIKLMQDILNTKNTAIDFLRKNLDNVPRIFKP